MLKTFSFPNISKLQFVLEELLFDNGSFVINDISLLHKVLKENIHTEETTKTSIVMPFFAMSGYDVFNPT